MDDIGIPADTAPPAQGATRAPDPARRRWRNPWRFLPTARALVQGAYVAFFLLVGVEFHSFVAQVASGGPVTAHRPPAVEGFLPISALMSLKYWLLTGNYDEVHPAGLAILIAALVSAFF